ncbi:MAG TPA: circadian clock protein KaiC [Methanotrichaceae archaeon]|nr:circadian clock protein KaiC [Methanotrichaceae archaeon]
MAEASATHINFAGLEKSPTGINGLDEITDGGLPKGRPTLIAGGAGSGKTLMSMKFLAQGAIRYDEPGVFVAFEETADELSKNFASLGFDLKKLIEMNKLLIDYIYIDSSEIEETGEYDLEGLFIRLGSAIDSIGAKRVVLDTLEVLFSGFKNEAILRSELRRLFRYLKSKGVTAIVTGERGEDSLTRYGLEEYVADCVILLDNRMQDQIATRRLRIIKYRGSKHGTNEYPFLIEDDGISVLPITSLGLDHSAFTETISSGIERLDNMLDGRGYYRGSSVLISGTAGTGKTSFAAHFAAAACKRGERSIYFAFEESPSQIIRNMRSIGIDLEPWVKAGLLQIRSLRPMAFGLEMHLADMHRYIDSFKPQVVIFDPISNLVNVGTRNDVRSMLTRLIDYLKTEGITAFCTSLVDYQDSGGESGQGVSSLMDTWLKLTMFENDNERNRGISVIKSRGMKHSNQIREFLLTDNGVKLMDVYLGPQGGLLMGSARVAQEARENEEIMARDQKAERKRRELEGRLKSLDAQMAVLRAEFETEEEELKKLTREDELRSKSLAQSRRDMAKLRKADAS